MNRRNALQRLGMLALLASPVSLALGQVRENFRTLKPGVPVNTVGKIEVLEFFHYGCPHCQAFEPLVAQWAAHLPDDVAFMGVPAVWGNFLESLARLYYTILAMKRLDLHKTVFTAVQEEQLQFDVREWAKANRLNESAFMDIYNSFGVNTQVQRARQLISSYKVDSVPMMAVAGRFLTSAAMAGNHEAALKVVDSLIDRIRKGG
ncbi:MAG: thiol:disulfide interchange protein DsbA/DsbL [Betaproteobacteria bacterium]|nr:thiol:disulfide interchange protein DsbA/DsbL [Betaproteobacteria bacterium]